MCGGAILAVNESTPLLSPKRNSKLKDVLKRFSCLARSPLKVDGSDDSDSQCALVVNADTGLSAQCLDSLRRDHLLIRSWLGRMKQPLNFLIENNLKLDNPELRFGGEALDFVRQYMEFQQGLQTEVSSFMNQINALYEEGQAVFAEFWRYDVEDGVIIEQSIPDAEVVTFDCGDDDCKRIQKSLTDLVDCFTRLGKIQERHKKCISGVQSAMTSATGDDTHDNQDGQPKIAVHVVSYAQYINDLQTATTKYSALFAQFLKDEQDFGNAAIWVRKAIVDRAAIQKRRALARRSFFCPCLSPCFVWCCGELKDEL
ncbi:MAG: hypothetical protein OXC30_06215 [Alphaproteobacteria bacterium]|nr:hypothetical protein [Alphaproteobacteria bacterium]